MILREATIKYAGYDPDKLPPKSTKRICISCNNCGRVKWVSKQGYHDLCNSCAHIGYKHTKESKIKMSKSMMGINKGYKHTNEAKIKMSKARKGKYCGEDNPNYKEKITIKCAYCGKLKNINPTYKHDHNFCNRKCYSKWQSINQCGENNPMYGRTGENNPNYGKFGKDSATWDHTITDEERLIGRFYPEYKQWRKAVYERDNYTCQICGGTNLNAHHLEGYANNKELRISLDNGITLCKKCHKDFHNKYGRRNNTKEQFIQYLKGEL